MKRSRAGIMRILAALACAVALNVFAQADEVAHPDPVVEARLKDLGEELRCLVCQNQTIADSHAPLAVDLRNQIRVMVRQGRTDDEIRAYMVERYGDFVLYKPPLKATTVLLWIGPFALLALGIAIVVMIARRKRMPQALPEVSAARREEIAALLEERAGKAARR
ncbi:MAG TPA: cytochrome c-type biogenesis protein [Usitatibacter sp.]|jgi:cytochrome c-type biogenesis protein CcmH|nr:cytochrome c-type biogenesis protein [Usitatibacter sp.]